jgi:hypothetical protein
VLQALGLLTSEEPSGLGQWLAPVVTNTHGDEVGMVSCRIELATTGG